MKNIITLAVLFISLIIQAQVGINNTSPKATLDITAKTTGSTTAEGLIAPRLDGVDIKGKDAKYDTAQKGAIVYALSAVASPSTKTANITAEGYYYFDGSVWQKLSNSSAPTVVVTSSALNGTYKAGTAMTASNTFTVTITNNSFSTADIAFNTSDLVLSGGLSVASVSPVTANNLIAGASVTVTYTLSGTPAACGTITATWNKLTLNSVKTTTVAPNPTFTCSAGSWVSVAPEYRLNGLINGTAYSGTYTLPYTGGGCTYAAETITQSGLTLTLTAGNYNTTGNLTYTLSGTYTGTTNGAVTFTTASGCTIYLGPCASCKEILNKGLTTADGVYYVDIDQAGSTYAPMKAQCDMTTDGGGWTLISNYTRTGNNGTIPTQRTSFPLIQGSLGANETSNTTAWGQINSSILNTISFTEARWRVEGGYYSSSDIWDIKTNLASNISALKAGTALTNNFVKLSAHNISGYPESYSSFGNAPMIIGGGIGVAGGCSGIVVYRTFITHGGYGTGINSEYHSDCSGTYLSSGTSALIRTYVR
ncbi:fibrinogen-like YCDxxxxGGGW domain-containing protein [Flavobacterium sp. B17]|uniref:fibrinogen-like YCDxxxxGGGW domain-containing protein n=1 Tax=Flavobacterium sp. B17 TaxID=95618 RepID=UPI000349F9E4|nr:fibrinogen-like YCDxxxxGGGW domain-containing protein [Flavobacterium sp. B17]